MKPNDSLKQQKENLLKKQAEYETWLQDHDANCEGHAEVKEKRQQVIDKLDEIEKELEVHD